MKIKVVTALLAFVVVSCANGPGDPSAGETVVSIVGTPFLLAFRVTVCVATVALAAPIAGASALLPNEGGREIRRDLGVGVAENCGPPYVLTSDGVETTSIGSNDRLGPDFGDKERRKY